MSERNITTILSTPRSIKSLLIAVLAFVMLSTAFDGIAQAADQYKTVAVADPYLEMRTGPGRGYPKFYAVDRGESVEILKRRTDWFLVRTSNGKEGWVDRAQMEIVAIARRLEDEGKISLGKSGGAEVFV